MHQINIIGSEEKVLAAADVNAFPSVEELTGLRNTPISFSDRLPPRRPRGDAQRSRTHRGALSLWSSVVPASRGGGAHPVCRTTIPTTGPTPKGRGTSTIPWVSTRTF